MNYRLLSAFMAVSALTAFAAYEINFPAETTIDTEAGSPARHLDGIALNSPRFGAQTAAVGQQTDKLLYHDLTGNARFKAEAGEAVTPSVNWAGTWMCSYLYIDFNNDGSFDPATELISYSYLNGRNSLGQSISDKTLSAANSCVSMPSFIIPAATAPGSYRMRYVIDWDYTDPAGRAGETNSIVDNRGAIADATLVVEAPEQTAPYPTAFDSDAQITNAERRLANINFAAEGLGVQKLNVGQDTDLKLVHDLTDKVLVASAGKSLATTFDWTGTWMSSYIYIDRDDDGRFNAAIDAASGAPLPGSDIMVYTHYNGRNSLGNTSTGEHVTPPAFTIPADLKPGIHRMRVKIDWDNIDPAGSTAEGNNILVNGGAITDLSLMVVDENAKRTIKAIATNGTLKLADGTDADGAAIPASGTLDLTAVPAEGYYFDGLRIVRTVNLPEGKTLIDPSMSGEQTLAATSAVNGVISLPASGFIADAQIEAIFIPAADAPKGGRYSSKYTSQLAAGAGFTSITANGTSFAVETANSHCFTDSIAHAERGTTFPLSADYKGNASEFRLLIDVNEDGEFYDYTESLGCEIMASGSKPEFSIKLPASLAAGVYRARIEACGDCDADFLINVYNPTVAISPKALNAILLTTNDQPLAETADAFTALTVKTKASVPGFAADSIIVRHGQNLGGPEFICGNRQWADTKVRLLKTGLANIPAEIVDGDIEIYALFTETPGSTWTKVWGDEFNDGKLDSKRWKYHPRYGATWNRLIAQGAEQQKLVNTFEDGYYNSWAIATPAEFTEETQPMISGAIFSNGTFDMTYGYVEARIKTTPHVGNFPAFWMMPSGSAPEIVELGLNGWPNDGEIDIWEQIDAQGASHHTVHSGWTGWKVYNNWSEAPKQGSPTSSRQNGLDATQWHVFAVDWDAETIKWLVDGKVVFTYANQHYSEPDSKYYSSERLTWPFDKNFYIILNQSVGNGSWAKNPDTSFNYKTMFDYVRVYQKKDGSQTNVSKLKGNGDDPEFYVPATGHSDFNDPTPDSIDDITADASAGPTAVFDLNGRRVSSSRLAPGLYIERNGSETRKIIVR